MHKKNRGGGGYPHSCSTTVAYSAKSAFECSAGWDVCSTIPSWTYLGYTRASNLVHDLHVLKRIIGREMNLRPLLPAAIKQLMRLAQL